MNPYARITHLQRQNNRQISHHFFSLSIDSRDATITTLGVYGPISVSLSSRTTAGSPNEPAMALLAPSVELWAQGGHKLHVVLEISPTIAAVARGEAARSPSLSCSSVEVASAAVKDAPGAVGGYQLRYPSNSLHQSSLLATPMTAVARGGQRVGARISVCRRQRQWTQQP